jgi:signal transduction histidine kinase
LDELKLRFDRNQKILKEQARLLNELALVNNKLVESEKLKSQFLSNIRNEINNPLTSILGLAQIISNGGQKEEDLKRVGQLIYQEAFILDFQLRNIFVAAELESGLLFPEASRVNVEQLVSQVLNEFGHLIKKKEIDIKVTIDVQDKNFFCDGEKIHMVLINLLSNAIEYSNIGGKLLLTISTDREKLTASIQDFGLGIDANDHQAIFDRFKQLDAGTTKTHQGHGLGLSVTRELVDLLGGTIDIESELSSGSKFTVQLPRFEQPENIDATFGGNEFLFEADEELF